MQAIELDARCTKGSVSHAAGTHRVHRYSTRFTVRVWRCSPLRASIERTASVAFTIVKFAGAAYLIYLGVNALRPSNGSAEVVQFQELELGRIFRQGLLVALLNPKTAIFFAAFLPQFINPAGSVIVQSALFGTVFVLIAACTDTAYVLAAGLAATAIGNVKIARSRGRYASAAVFIGLGIFTAASGTRSPQ